MMGIMDIVDKKIKVGDIAYIIEHEVYGDPKAPLNEPEVYEATITKYENGLYDGSWTKGFGSFINVPEKLVHKRKGDAYNYIDEHKDEIIKESFAKHKKWLKEQIKKARNPIHDIF